jgi:hypothetical protein
MKGKVSLILGCCFLFLFACKTPSGTAGIIDENGDLNLSENGHKIVFADKTLGQATIIKDDVDRYFERIQELDMKIQMNSISRGDKVTLLKDYKLHLQNSVMEWSDLEKTFVGNVMEKAFELVNAINPDIFPKEIIMIKNNMNHYGEGVFYTRENSIVIPLNTVQNQDSADFLKTMIHEVFHIYARYEPEVKRELYERIGYRKIEAPAIPEILKKRVLLNPDGVDYNYAINIKRKSTGQEITAMPIIFSKYLNYMPAKTDFFDYLEFALFEVADGEIQVTRNGESTVRIKNVTKFYEQIGTNTQYIIHPDEVLADNFVIMCLSNEDKKVLEQLNIRPVGEELINDIKAIVAPEKVKK